MTGDRPTPTGPDVSAAEHALGFLTGDELLRAESRLEADSGYAADVARWRGRLAPLHGETEAVDPPGLLWSRIASAIGGSAVANDNNALLRRRLVLWRSFAAGMTAIAAGLAVVVLFPTRASIAPTPVERTTAAPMVALLGDAQATKVVASWDPNARQLVLAVSGEMPGDPAHSHELWVIPSDGKPRSLGTMSDRKQMHLRLADALASLLQQGATIAVSVEPRGGSRTGAPTGPVIAAGALRST